MDSAEPVFVVPGSVKTAAGLLVLVPLWLLVVGSLFAGAFVFPLLVHLALVALIAAGLVRGWRLAWWLGVGLGFIRLLSCAVPLGALAVGKIPRTAVVETLLVAGVPLALLAAVLVLLLAPAGRSLIRTRATDP